MTGLPASGEERIDLHPQRLDNQFMTAERMQNNRWTSGLPSLEFLLGGLICAALHLACTGIAKGVNRCRHAGFSR